MDLQTYLDNACTAARQLSFGKSDQLTLGEIISKCETIALSLPEEGDDERVVVFDFEYLHPTGIDSWRGIYAELALEFSVDGDRMKLSEFIALLKSAVGKTFTGYKGGEFTMSRHTPVWVANYGNSGNTVVIEVVDNGYYSVILITGYREA